MAGRAVAALLDRHQLIVTVVPERVSAAVGRRRPRGLTTDWVMDQPVVTTSTIRPRRSPRPTLPALRAAGGITVTSEMSPRDGLARAARNESKGQQG